MHLILYLRRCYLHSQDFENGLKVFEDYMSADKIPAMELYTVTRLSDLITGVSIFALRVNFLFSIYRVGIKSSIKLLFSILKPRK